MSQEEDWLYEASNKLKKMPAQASELRERALSDLAFFARLVNPSYVYGRVHMEVFNWLQDYTLFGYEKSLTANKLLMLPRGHLKSHIVATWCAWIITRHPEVTILYVSATASLAETQLYAIKNMLGSSTYRRYFPEYVHPQEGKREKWSATSLSIDHVRRKSEGIRDCTINTAGLTTNTTGWHADVIVSDDLVVPENAYTEDGRESVSRKSSQFTSIRNAGGFTLACGTRYHPRDVYSTWKEQVYEVYDDDGFKVDEQQVWEIFEREVETDGVYIWPRTVREDGKAFGYNQQILARIRAEYADKVQFYAQYYNNPNDPQSDRISRDKFQYFNPRLLNKESGRWWYKGRKLNIYASIDFAFSLKKGSDYTAIVVVGIDCDSNIYVLDIDRFKSDRTSEYFQHIKQLHAKWRFSKLRAEVTVAQQIIVNGIRDFINKDGMTIKIEDYRPSRKEGSKEERIAATLEHRYDNMEIYHCEGGWTSALEEELVLARPQHDDLKDALASAIAIATPPSKGVGGAVKDLLSIKPGTTTRNRFGGVR